MVTPTPELESSVYNTYNINFKNLPLKMLNKTSGLRTKFSDPKLGEEKNLSASLRANEHKSFVNSNSQYNYGDSRVKFENMFFGRKQKNFNKTELLKMIMIIWTLLASSVNAYTGFVPEFEMDDLIIDYPQDNENISLKYCSETYDNKYGTTVHSYFVANENGLEANKKLYELSHMFGFHGTWPREVCTYDKNTKMESRLKIRTLHSVNEEVSIELALIASTGHGSITKCTPFGTKHFKHEYDKHFKKNGYSLMAFTKNLAKRCADINNVNDFYVHSCNVNINPENNKKEICAVNQIVIVDDISSVSQWNIDLINTELIKYIKINDTFINMKVKDKIHLKEAETTFETVYSFFGDTKYFTKMKDEYKNKMDFFSSLLADIHKYIGTFLTLVTGSIGSMHTKAKLFAETASSVDKISGIARFIGVNGLAIIVFVMLAFVGNMDKYPDFFLCYVVVCTVVNAVINRSHSGRLLSSSTIGYIIGFIIIAGIMFIFFSATVTMHFLDPRYREDVLKEINENLDTYRMTPLVQDLIMLHGNKLDQVILLAKRVIMPSILVIHALARIFNAIFGSNRESKGFRVVHVVVFMIFFIFTTFMTWYYDVFGFYKDYYEFFSNIRIYFEYGMSPYCLFIGFIALFMFQRTIVDPVFTDSNLVFSEVNMVFCTVYYFSFPIYWIAVSLSNSTAVTFGEQVGLTVLFILVTIIIQETPQINVLSYVLQTTLIYPMINYLCVFGNHQSLVIIVSDLLGFQIQPSMISLPVAICIQTIINYSLIKVVKEIHVIKYDQFIASRNWGEIVVYTIGNTFKILICAVLSGYTFQSIFYSWVKRTSWYHWSENTIILCFMIFYLCDLLAGVAWGLYINLMLKVNQRAMTRYASIALGFIGSFSVLCMLAFCIMALSMNYGYYFIIKDIIRGFMPHLCSTLLISIFVPWVGLISDMGRQILIKSVGNAGFTRSVDHFIRFIATFWQMCRFTLICNYVLQIIGKVIECNNNMYNLSVTQSVGYTLFLIFCAIGVLEATVHISASAAYYQIYYLNIVRVNVYRRENAQNLKNEAQEDNFLDVVRQPGNMSYRQRFAQKGIVEVNTRKHETKRSESRVVRNSDSVKLVRNPVGAQYVFNRVHTPLNAIPENATISHSIDNADETTTNTIDTDIGITKLGADIRQMGILNLSKFRYSDSFFGSKHSVVEPGVLYLSDDQDARSNIAYLTQNETVYCPAAPKLDNELKVKEATLNSLKLTNNDTITYNQINSSIKDSKSMIDILGKYCVIDTIHMEAEEKLDKSFFYPGGFFATTAIKYLYDRFKHDGIQYNYVDTNLSLPTDNDTLGQETIFTLDEYARLYRIKTGHEYTFRRLYKNVKDGKVNVVMESGGKTFVTESKVALADLLSTPINKFGVATKFFQMTCYPANKGTGYEPFRFLNFCTYASMSQDNTLYELKEDTCVLANQVGNVSMIDPGVIDGPYKGQNKKILDPRPVEASVIAFCTGLVYRSQNYGNIMPHLGSCFLFTHNHQVYVGTNLHVTSDHLRYSSLKTLDAIFAVNGKTFKTTLGPAVSYGVDFSIHIITGTDLIELEDIMYGLTKNKNLNENIPKIGNIGIKPTYCLNTVRQSDRPMETDKTKVCVNGLMVTYDKDKNMYRSFGYSTPGYSGSPIWQVDTYDNKLKVVGIVSAVEKRGLKMVNMTRIVDMSKVSIAIDKGFRDTTYDAVLASRSDYYNQRFLQADKMWCTLLEPELVHGLWTDSTRKEIEYDGDYIMCANRNKSKYQKYYEVYDKEFDFMNHISTDIIEMPLIQQTAITFSPPDDFFDLSSQLQYTSIQAILDIILENKKKNRAIGFSTQNEQIYFKPEGYLWEMTTFEKLTGTALTTNNVDDQFVMEIVRCNHMGISICKLVNAMMNVTSGDDVVTANIIGGQLVLEVYRMEKDKILKTTATDNDLEKSEVIVTFCVDDEEMFVLTDTKNMSSQEIIAKIKDINNRMQFLDEEQKKIGAKLQEIKRKRGDLMQAHDYLEKKKIYDEAYEQYESAKKGTEGKGMGIDEQYKKLVELKKSKNDRLIKQAGDIKRKQQELKSKINEHQKKTKEIRIKENEKCNEMIKKIENEIDNKREQLKNIREMRMSNNSSVMKKRVAQVEMMENKLKELQEEKKKIQQEIEDNNAKYRQEVQLLKDSAPQRPNPEMNPENMKEMIEIREEIRQLRELNKSYIQERKKIESEFGDLKKKLDEQAKMIQTCTEIICNNQHEDVMKELYNIKEQLCGGSSRGYTNAPIVEDVILETDSDSYDGIEETKKGRNTNKPKNALKQKGNKRRTVTIKGPNGQLIRKEVPKDDYQPYPGENDEEENNNKQEEEFEIFLQENPKAWDKRVEEEKKKGRKLTPEEKKKIMPGYRFMRYEHSTNQFVNCEYKDLREEDYLLCSANGNKMLWSKHNGAAHEIGEINGDITRKQILEIDDNLLGVLKRVANTGIPIIPNRAFRCIKSVLLIYDAQRKFPIETEKQWLFAFFDKETMTHYSLHITTEADILVMFKIADILKSTQFANMNKEFTWPNNLKMIRDSIASGIENKVKDLSELTGRYVHKLQSSNGGKVTVSISSDGKFIAEKRITKLDYPLKQVYSANNCPDWVTKMLKTINGNTFETNAIEAILAGHGKTGYVIYVTGDDKFKSEIENIVSNEGSTDISFLYQAQSRRRRPT
uniref:Uncharacterized protein n=1 Tax=Bemisia tabaci nido-like virus 1 TaxID=2840075 RepID=A0A8E8FUG0_9NIDO|nr:hypothetical protein [Bemisia tabaci nido-like virus 1]